MSANLPDSVDLRPQGFEVLVKSVGWVNAVRLIQHYESSRLDYTRERDQILPDRDTDTLLRKARERSRG